VNGTNGYTPIYGIDYRNGSDGINGVNGSQGIQGIQGIPGVNGTFTDIVNSTQMSNSDGMLTILESWLKSLFYTKAEINSNNVSWSSTYNATYDSKTSANLSWNQSFANTLYTQIGVTGDNSSWNESYANTKYAGAQWDYNQTTPAIDNINSRFWNNTQSYNISEINNNLSLYYRNSNPLNFINSTSISNSTIARIGSCPAGQVVQNTTNSGVQCITLSAGSEIDPAWSGNLTNGFSSDLNPLTNIIQGLGSSAKRWLKGWFKDLDVSNNITVAGNISAAYYYGSLNKSTFPISSCSGSDKAIGLNVNGSVICGADQTGGSSGSEYMMFSGRSTSTLATDAWFSPSGGASSSSQEPSQATYMPYSGVIQNLSGSMSATQGSGDTCAFIVMSSSTIDGTYSNVITCTMQDAVNNCVNATTSGSISARSYIKVLFDEQAGSCSGIPAWSFVYEIT